MRKITVIMGVLALAFGALADEPSSAAAAPQGAAEARKTLADFFLRTKGATRVVSAAEVWEGIRSGKSRYRVVDVRQPEDYEKGHVPGAINIPLDVLFHPASLETLPVAGDPIVLVCYSGHMESMALDGVAAGALRIHADSPSAHHGLAHRVDRAGEEGPHPRAGAVRAGVGGEPGRIVELGVHADRDEVERGLEVARASLDPGHLPGDCRADRVAPCEDEARHPHAPREVLRTEGASVLRGELEWRQGSEDLQPRWHGRAQRPHDRPGGDERDEERTGDRARHHGAHCALEAIAKGRWACGGHSARIVAAGGEA